jgi:hypothetical protein
LYRSIEEWRERKKRKRGRVRDKIEKRSIIRSSLKRRSPHLDSTFEKSEGEK